VTHLLRTSSSANWVEHVVIPDGDYAIALAIRAGCEEMVFKDKCGTAAYAINAKSIVHRCTGEGIPPVAASKVNRCIGVNIVHGAAEREYVMLTSHSPILSTAATSSAAIYQTAAVDGHVLLAADVGLGKGRGEVSDELWVEEREQGLAQQDQEDGEPRADPSEVECSSWSCVPRPTESSTNALGEFENLFELAD
jgi:hypothetical protein